ncbi:hypothetical protein Tco_0980948 [Tanacetum coccineum]
MSTFVLCVGCGEPLYGHPCQRCTCERCGNDLRDGYCFLCNSRNENSFIYDSSPNSFDNPPDFSYPPPQPQTYSCEFCGNDAHYCYDCPPQVPFIYNPEPCYNQDFNFPQNFQSYPQQYPCCENCGGPHETFQCQPLNQNCYDYNSPGFDQFQPPQYPVIHQPIREKTCAELLAEERTANINTQSTQYSVVHQPPQETSLEFLQDNRNLINSVQTFLGKFKRFSFYETPKVVSLAWETISEIEHAFEDKQYQPEGILELFRKLHDDVQNIHEELAEYINTPSWNRPTIYCDDDDDDLEFISLVGIEEGIVVAAVGTKVYTRTVGMKNGDIEVVVMVEGMMTWTRDRDIDREYHKYIWCKVRLPVGMDAICPRVADIILYIIPRSARVVLVAKSYYIWQESNSRLFEMKFKTHEHIYEEIITNVRLSLVTSQFKRNTIHVRSMIAKRKLPSSFVLNDITVST